MRKLGSLVCVTLAVILLFVPSSEASDGRVRVCLALDTDLGPRTFVRIPWGTAFEDEGRFCGSIPQNTIAPEGSALRKCWESTKNDKYQWAYFLSLGEIVLSLDRRCAEVYARIIRGVRPYVEDRSTVLKSEHHGWIGFEVLGYSADEGDYGTVIGQPHGLGPLLNSGYLQAEQLTDLGNPVSVDAMSIYQTLEDARHSMGALEVVERLRSELRAKVAASSSSP